MKDKKLKHVKAFEDVRVRSNYETFKEDLFVLLGDEESVNGILDVFRSRLEEVLVNERLCKDVNPYHLIEKILNDE